MPLEKDDKHTNISGAKCARFSMQKKEKEMATITKTILINSIDKVKAFVKTANQYEETIDIHSGRYTIDGKSIMGVFSLDLTRELELVIEGEEEKIEKIWEELQIYEVEDSNVAQPNVLAYQDSRDFNRVREST